MNGCLGLIEILNSVCDDPELKENFRRVASEALRKNPLQFMRQNVFPLLPKDSASVGSEGKLYEDLPAGTDLANPEEAVLEQLYQAVLDGEGEGE